MKVMVLQYTWFSFLNVCVYSSPVSYNFYVSVPCFVHTVCHHLFAISMTFLTNIESPIAVYSVLYTSVPGLKSTPFFPTWESAVKIRMFFSAPMFRKMKCSKASMSNLLNYCYGVLDFMLLHKF